MLEALVAAIAGLLGLFFYQKTKTQSAEALLNNLEKKEKLLEKDKKIAVNDGLAEIEDEKVKQKRKETDDEKNKQVSNDDLVNHLNNTHGNK